MAAKMERMEEMFMKREEEMKLELREMEERMEMQETKIRAELDTIREAPQVFKFDLFHLFDHYELSGAVLRLPEQMELHGNSDIFPIHLKLQQCGPGVKYTLSIHRGFLQNQLFRHEPETEVLYLYADFKDGGGDGAMNLETGVFTSLTSYLSFFLHIRNLWFNFSPQKVRKSRQNRFRDKTT